MLPRHIHERASLNVVLAGGYAESIRGNSATHPPFSLVIKPPGETHANHFRHAGACCLLIEPTSIESGVLGDGEALFKQPSIRPAADAVQGALRIARLLGHNSRSLDLLESGVYDLIVLAGARDESGPTPPPHWLRRVRDHLHDLDGQTVRLAELAASTGHHPMHVTRQFRRFYGVSIGQYVRRLRLARAARMLGGVGSIAAAALEAGFYDHSHFTRHFRRLTGMPPSEFQTLLGARFDCTSARRRKP